MNSHEAAARYEQKKRLCQGIDPYAVKTTHQGVPLTVNFNKIYQFLIVDPCPFMQQPKDSSNSMDAVLFYKNGWVKSITGAKLGDVYVVHGEVHHSFGLNHKKLRTWAIVNEDGTILAAHCSCTIGILEACSHIGATLFALDGVRTEILEKKLSVTDLPAYWKKPPVRITDELYKKVADINFGRKIKRFNPLLQHAASYEDRARDMLLNIQEDKINVAAMALFCGDPKMNYICRPCIANDEVKQRFNGFNLRAMFDEALTTKSLKELRGLASTIFNQLPRDPHIFAEIESITKTQSNSMWWNIMRAGRITATSIRAVCKTSKTKPSISLINKICYPELEKVSTPSMRYGVEHEPTAIDALFHAVTDVHRGLTCTKSGLVISAEEPYLGASPDAIFKCECHGIISVEVKCPYTARDCPDIIDVLMNLSDPYISKFEDGSVALIPSHKYYYQCLAQIHLTGAAFGYFCVWSPNQKLIFEVQRNDTLWLYCKQIAAYYHKNFIIPELIGKAFTNQL